MFDGLLPEPHNETILKLLFICAHWHGLAKLRVHTDDTLKIFDEVTSDIGAEFRVFERDTCSAFKTRELPRESNARMRRRRKKESGEPARTRGGTSVPALEGSGDFEEPLSKKFNLQRYKHHALGDYPNAIRQFGTTDSYSTELVMIFLHLGM